MKEGFNICLEKNCSYCCDPVKVDHSFPNEKIPKDKQGEPLWKQKEGTLVSKERPDGIKI